LSRSTQRNERWEELHRHPDWSFPAPQFPRHAKTARRRCSAWSKRHPKTTFISAHVASNAEDLATGRPVAGSNYPNLHVEIASRISELGRQPFTARRFFVKYAGPRFCSGPMVPGRSSGCGFTGNSWRRTNEYFPYSEKPFPPQGFWQIYGVHLPDEVLRKVYHENAARIVPGVAERLRKFQRDSP
jgi:hypothetical protein